MVIVPILLIQYSQIFVLSPNTLKKSKSAFHHRQCTQLNPCQPTSFPSNPLAIIIFRVRNYVSHFPFTIYITFATASESNHLSGAKKLSNKIISSENRKEHRNE